MARIQFKNQKALWRKIYWNGSSYLVSLHNLNRQLSFGKNKGKTDSIFFFFFWRKVDNFLTVLFLYHFTRLFRLEGTSGEMYSQTSCSVQGQYGIQTRLLRVLSRWILKFFKEKDWIPALMLDCLDGVIFFPCWKVGIPHLVVHDHSILSSCCAAL